MKLFLIAILFLYSKIITAETKVIVALSTTIQDELNLADCFVAGYESEGRNWTGAIRIFEHVSNGIPLYQGIMNLARDSGYTLVLRNSKIQDGEFNYDSSYANGIQLVVCAGSNLYRSNTQSAPLSTYIICGAGRTENVTGYRCEFYDEHPYSQFNISVITDSSGFAKITLATPTFLYDSTVSGYQKIEFFSVDGFANNPSGLIVNHKFYNDGFYNKFRIRHSLSTGSYSGGGYIRAYYQSYSHAYIAGKLAAIKDSLNCSWWEARYRMRQTASHEGNFNEFDGYGKPDLSAAINFSGEIPEDPFKLGQVGVLTATRRDNKVSIAFDTVPGAILYELYDNSVLLQTVTQSLATSYITSQIPLVFNTQRNKRGVRHDYWYRALRLSEETPESKKVSIPYYKFRKIKLR
ncbi:MAG: hypothetical protein HGGPFJEG_03049 [Ignavibacteria bacterium]|nr:hypothetical protein [Ignavibacteria bacterium]